MTTNFFLKVILELLVLRIFQGQEKCGETEEVVMSRAQSVYE